MGASHGRIQTVIYRLGTLSAMLVAACLIFATNAAAHEPVLTPGSAVPGSEGKAVVSSIVHPEAPSAIGALSIAVIVVDYSDQVNPYTQERVENLYFNNEVGAGNTYTQGRSVANYFSEVSQSQMSLTGDVIGPYTIDRPVSPCSYDQNENAVSALLEQDAVSLAGYDLVQFVFPRVNGCAWGYGFLWNKYTTIYGPVDNDHFVYVAVHEIGHNFGMGHAGTMSCTDGDGYRVSISSTCASLFACEYCDEYDPMGSGDYAYYSGFNQALINWIGDEEITMVEDDATVTLVSPEKGLDGTRLLAIARPTSGPEVNDDYLYVEYRQTGEGVFGSRFPQWNSNGVQVRIAGSLSTSSNLMYSYNPYYLDGDISTSYESEPLAPGRTLHDPDSDISITVNSVGVLGAEVAVDFGEDVTPPAAPSAPEQMGLLGGAVKIDLPPLSGDVTRFKIYRDGVSVGSAQGYDYTDSGLEVAATHNYTITAVDRAGNESSQSAVLEGEVSSDGTPPSTPTNFAISDGAGDNVDLTWTNSTDNVSVDHYELWRRNPGASISPTLYLQINFESIFTTWLGNGEYFLRAADPSGNVSELSAAVVWPPLSLDVTAPNAPVLYDDSHETQTWSDDNTIDGHLQAFDNIGGSGLDGFSIVWDTVADTVPDEALDMESEQTTFTSPTLADGASHYVHVRSIDAAGNAGATAHLGPFYIDVSAPTVSIAALPSFRTTMATQLQLGGIDSGSGLAGWTVTKRYAPLNAGFGSASVLQDAQNVATPSFAGLPGRTYCVSAQSMDIFDHLSEWHAPRCTAFPVHSKLMSKTGTWAGVTAASLYRGSALRSKIVGSALKAKVRGYKFALVASTCSRCGSVKVTVAGVSKTISLKSATARNGVIFPILTRATNYVGTVTIKVATVNSYGVRVEGLGVLQKL